MYEYCLIEVEKKSPEDKLPQDQVLARAGKMAEEGWVLLSVVPDPFRVFGLTAFFRREKK